MRKNLIIILSVIVAVTLVAAALLYSNKDNAVFSKETSLYKAVPLTAPVFVEASSLKSLPLDNSIIADLSAIPAFAKEIGQIKKIQDLIRTEDDIQDNLRNRPVVLAFDFVGKDILHPVIITSLKSSKEVSAIEILIEKMTGIPQSSFRIRKYDGKKITEVVDSNGKTKLQFCIVDNLLIISNNDILVEKCIRQYASIGIAANRDFIQVNKTVTAQSEVSWYINHKYFTDFFGTLVNDKTNEKKDEFGAIKKINLKRDVKKLEDYAGWSELDLTFLDSYFALQGISTANDSMNQFLSIFKGQMPINCNAARILPRQTTFYVDISLSDKDNFFKKLENYYIHSNAYYNREEKFKKIDEAAQCDSRDVFQTLTKDEILTAVTSISSNNKEIESLFILTSEYDAEKRAGFEGMIKSYAKRKKIDFNTLVSSYNTSTQRYRIYKFPFPSFPSIWLGGAWSFTKANYAAFTNNALVFASSKQGLLNYLEDMNINETLNGNASFSEFNAESDNKANLSVYANIDHVYNFTNELFNEKTAKALKKNKAVFNNFHNLSWKMVCENNIFYNSVLVGCEQPVTQSSNNSQRSTNPKSISNARSLWEYDLGASVAMRPQIVVNHRNKSANEIIVQDTNNRLHLISCDGKSVWKNPIAISGKIIGAIHQIDYYRNGKFQYLFNTKDKIYLIDRLGRKVANFPILLKSPATNGVNVFDYDNNKKYRYFVACENKKVYAYNHEGKIITGWKFGNTAGIVKTPVHHFRVAGKDYIVFHDETKVYIQNRQGATRVNCSANFAPSDNDIVLDTHGTPKMIVSDKRGTVYYLFFDGKYEEKETDKFSGDHTFTAEDINGDNKPEFIFTDKNRLTVYNESGKKVFSEKFRKKLSDELGVYSFASNRKLIGVITSEDNKIYLYEPTGKECKGFPLEGNSGFVIGKLTPKGRTSLIVGSRNQLFNYALD